MTKKIFKRTIMVLIICILGIGVMQAQTVRTVSAASSTTKTKKPSGLVKKGTRYYYYSKGKPIKNTWKTVKKNKYYFNKKGQAKIGCGNVNGKYYFFKGDGKLYRPKKPTLAKSGHNNTFYVNTNGQTLRGWRVIKNKLYYFAGSSGRMLKGTKHQGITLTKSGAARNDNATKLKRKTMSIVASITNSSMSKSQKLYKCWQYVAGGSFRYSPKYPNLNSKGWQRTLALDMLNTRAGNCYGFACAFAALAEEVGYNPVVVCGRVAGSRDHAADGYTRHSWVKIDNRHYDPEGQYAGWARGVYGYSYYPFSHQIQRYVNF